MSDPKSGVSAETLQSISTPDKVETGLGILEFEDGDLRKNQFLAHALDEVGFFRELALKLGNVR